MKPLPLDRSLAADRLPFLDVLRGIAATAVVVEHGLAVAIPGYLDWSVRYFDLGQFGVTLFMLISGFIIPVSLERGQSNKRFWVNRFFRLFPLYWASIAFYWIYYQSIAPERMYPAETWQWLVNLTMCQEFLRLAHVNPVFWTLTLELTFYASCSLVYALGLSRRTLVVVWLGQTGLMVLGVCLPLLAERRFPSGYAFLFLSMFVGTLFHRHTTGDVTRRQLLLVLATLAPVSLAASYVGFAMFTRVGYPFTFHCVFAVWLAAYVAFACGFAQRTRPMPGLLCYLGKISYSIYLVHAGFVLALPHDWPGTIYLCTFLGGTWGVSALTYRLIEKPGIDFGRRLLSTTPPPHAVTTEARAQKAA